MKFFKLVSVALSLLIVPFAATADTLVFSADFESGLPAEITAAGSVIEGVQGYAGLGPSGNQFGGSFLRYTELQLYNTTITLTGLPAHDHVSLSVLLAVIDSWDGTELLQVEIDGTQVFSHWFQLALGDDSSYIAPTGGLLSSGVNLGFSNSGYHYRDRAYNLGVDPAFTVPHTASSVTIVFKLNAVPGGGASFWQGGSDESWAIDNVRVSVSSQATGVGGIPELPSTLTLLPNQPNPFSSVTAFRTGSPASGSARIEVYDVRGRRLVGRSVPLSNGWQSVAFDGRDDAGTLLPGGVYFYRITVAGQSRTQKFVIAR
jgi:hypothetical protein